MSIKHEFKILHKSVFYSTNFVNKKIYNIMSQETKNCQSCEMPLKKSPNGDGTNADKSISKMYCA